MSTQEQEVEARIKREREAKEANQRRNQERLQRLDDIANGADDFKNREEGVEDIEDRAWNDRNEPQPPHDGADDHNPREIVDATEDEIDETREAGADDIKTTNGVTYYRLIVNGQERWMTLAQLRETSSKVTAADEYLRNAKESAKSIQGLIPSSDESASVPSGDTRALIARVIMGEQEAIDELAQVLERRPSVKDVARAVDERVDGRLTFRDAVNWFEQKYSAEMKDPDLKRYIVTRDAQLAAENPTMDYKERLTAVGEEARRISGGSPAPLAAPKGRSEKESRKASVRSVPSAAGRQFDQEDDEDGETYESAIAQIAKHRGQNRPTIHTKR